MTNRIPPTVDPLHSWANKEPTHHGAVLLSDQIEYYINDLEPPLLARPDGSRLSHDELWEQGCLDTASYKLRLGDAAHLGGEPVRISDEDPLILPPHQVAVVKTYEIVNIPAFLVARWNLRVRWVYEGLLWVGGPQVDPGWKGVLYCPIYNLAERTLVIPFKERVFTMDFTRTTPVDSLKDSHGYATKKHEPARKKTLQGHDGNRLRSAPFEELARLATIEGRINAFIPLTFVLIALMFSAIGILGSLGGNRGDIATEALGGLTGLFAVSASAMVFGIFGVAVSMMAMYTAQGRVFKGKGAAVMKQIAWGASSLAAGTALSGALLASVPLPFPYWQKFSLWSIAVILVGVGAACFYVVWLRVTRTTPN